MRDTTNPTRLNLHSEILFFLMLAYAMALAFANWFDARLISVFGMETDAGTLIFPFTFLLSDLITEVYGYKNARRAIWYGFIFNLLYVAYGQLVIHLPSPNVETNHLFDQLLTINARIIVASIISYLISEPTNSFILAKLKLKTNGRLMSLRFLSSTFVASGLDSVLFYHIAFFALFPHQTVLYLIATGWAIKVLIECAGLPLSTYLAKRLKAQEMIDIYDNTTKFNLFNLDTSYSSKNNRFTPVAL